MTDAVPKGKLRVSVTDDEGQVETTTFGPDDYMILTIGECWVDGISVYPKTGTAQLTIRKQRRRR